MFVGRRPGARRLPSSVHLVELWELTAREEIRDLVARYTWAGDRGRIDDLTELFQPDGVLDVGPHGGRWVGRTGISSGLRAVADRLARSGTAEAVHHHVASTCISELTPDTATVRSYYAVHSSIGLDHWGRYRDRVARTPEGWLFAERLVTVDGAADGSRVVEG